MRSLDNNHRAHRFDPLGANRHNIRATGPFARKFSTFSLGPKLEHYVSVRRTTQTRKAPDRAFPKSPKCIDRMCDITAYEPPKRGLRAIIFRSRGTNAVSRETSLARAYLTKCYMNKPDVIAASSSLHGRCLVSCASLRVPKNRIWARKRSSHAGLSNPHRQE